jgi:hypothetical protein
MTGKQIRFVAVVVTVLLTSAPSAQSVPLHEALMAAKTAVVINDGANQDYYERLIMELNDWKRFTLVDDAEKADIAISLSSGSAVVTNWATGQANSATTLFVSFKKGDTVLYRDQLKGCCSIKAMTRKTLEKLDKRMRQEEKK